VNRPNKSEQRRLAEALRKMHCAPPLLLLPNAWDAMSARIFEAAGFPAVATTSGGVAWALGFPDGEKAPWHEVVAATERIVRAVRVPVTADIEAGYGEAPDQVAHSVEEIIAAGAVGLNLEDGTPDPERPVRSLEDAVERIRAAREAALAADVPVVINARIDLYLKHVGDDESRFADTVRRGKAYMAAGADCIFPFGLGDLKIVGELIKALKVPINIVGRAGTPNVARLEQIGVARVSTASGPSLVAMSLIRQMAVELRTKGAFDMLDSAIKRPEAQQLFAARPDQRVDS
jgi:2-methylisocitrate lyase-like PEP mutase family enzyme